MANRRQPPGQRQQPAQQQPAPQQPAPQQQQQQPGNPPVMRVRLGLISVSIWERWTGAGQEARAYYQVTVQTSYKNRQTGAWEHTDSLDAGAIPTAIYLLQRATDWITDSLNGAPVGDDNTPPQ